MCYILEYKSYILLTNKSVKLVNEENKELQKEIEKTKNQNKEIL